jgi:hypothetical protein
MFPQRPLPACKWSRAALSRPSTDGIPPPAHSRETDMIKTLFTAALIVTAFAAQSQAGPWPNGVELNGLHANGLNPNGLPANGLHTNGLINNGLYPQGINLQGRSGQGTTIGTTGFAIDGIELPAAAR